MPTYEVVLRQAKQVEEEAVIEVEADDAASAEEVARDQVDSYFDFNEVDSYVVEEPEVISVSRVVGDDDEDED